MDVNGQRLTSSAGGYDDGEANDGALITVGGLDDSTANPPDPNAGPGGDDFYDDELYSLLDFITVADSSITVGTSNPTGDDDIFFAYFHLSGAAIVGGGIVLGPDSAVNPVGTNHTVTATVVDDAGAPLLGVTVDFEVLTGPNAGDMGSSVTNASGQALFSYLGDGGVGVDTIVARFDPGQGAIESNTVTKTWEIQQERGIPTILPVGGLALALLISAAGLAAIRRTRP